MNKKCKEFALEYFENTILIEKEPRQNHSINIIDCCTIFFLQVIKKGY